jgi:hypothetical protein
MTASSYTMVGAPGIGAGPYRIAGGIGPFADGPRPMAAGPGPVAGRRPMAGAVGPLTGGPRPMAAGPGPIAGVRSMAGAVGPLAGGPRQMAAGPGPVAGVRPMAGAVGPLADGPRPMDPGPGNSFSIDLLPGSQLNAGDNLFSRFGAFVLTLQPQDGNLVLYAFNDWDSRWDVPLWSIVNDGVILPLQNPFAAMQTDGNFVVYAEYPTYPGNFFPAWSTGTYGRDGQGVFLRMQDDGNLVEYLPDGQFIWASGTCAGLH